VTEWEERCEAIVVVEAISDEDAFAVVGFIVNSGILLGGVAVGLAVTHWEGQWKLSRWDHVAKENVGDGVTCFLCLLVRTRERNNLILFEPSSCPGRKGQTIDWTSSIHGMRTAPGVLTTTTVFA